MVTSGVGIAWRTLTTERDTLAHSLAEDADEVYVEDGGFQVTFRREQRGKFISTLHVRNLMDLNNTNLTCEGVYIMEVGRIERITESTTICVLGEVHTVYIFLFVDGTNYSNGQVQPQLPLLCQWCGTHHQLWSVSSLQCMVENVWTFTWSLLSVTRKRGISHVIELFIIIALFHSKAKQILGVL